MLVGVRVGVAVGVRVGVAVGVRVAVSVGVGVAPVITGRVKPTNADIAAGGVAPASSTSAVQVNCAEVLTIRAIPCATPGTLITCVSKNSAVPVVPRVMVAPGATASTAPLPALILLSTVPLGPNTSTPTSIGVADNDVQKKSISTFARLMTPGTSAACVAMWPLENWGSGAAAGTAPGAGRMPSPMVANETGGVTAGSSRTTLQRTLAELASTRATPCMPVATGIVADSRYAAVRPVPMVTVWPGLTLRTTPTSAVTSFTTTPSNPMISTPISTAPLSAEVHRKSVSMRVRRATPGTVMTSTLGLPSENGGKARGSPGGTTLAAAETGKAERHAGGTTPASSASAVQLS